MKGLSDDMAAAGRPLDDEEIVEYILTGLDHELDPLVSALVAKVEPISLGELYAQLLSFETRMSLRHDGGQSGSSANYSGHGSGGATNQHGRGGGRGCGNGGRGRGNSSNNNSSSQGSGNSNNRANHSSNEDRPLCQVCFKRGHAADKSGTGTMRIMSQIRSLWLQRRRHTPWTQIGTPTQVHHITLLEI